MTPRQRGKPGVLRKTLTGFQKDFFWAGKVPKCRSVCHHFGRGQGGKCSQRPPWTLWFSLPLPLWVLSIALELISLGDFPKSAHRNKWIKVCTDYSTRHGAPRVIITDRGAVFRSRLVSSLVDLCNIDHRFTTAYHPQTNGLTEHFNKTLAPKFFVPKIFVDAEQKKRDEILPFVTFAFNTAKQKPKRFYAVLFLHGREAKNDTQIQCCHSVPTILMTITSQDSSQSRRIPAAPVPHSGEAQDRDRRRYDSKPKWYLTLTEGVSYGKIPP
ncbi:transposon Ty3-I Gag-Pol polyprotein [Trichonephila inaurata madagascariensis]|uniref:Transposon Ty3-I Gag-Pol polyprotein n=1 Tax=Trichonephila inaurata madagascariensis TaxID=2747483 RepID=A0A8X6XXZ4_9ARAC|nr:transposon Ty3-I Gag-Pol polyprotein [Trichonephila inaurata madagascariensis]